MSSINSLRLVLFLACLLLGQARLRAQDDDRTAQDRDSRDHPRNVSEAGNERLDHDAIAPRESLLDWIIRSLGPIGLLIPVAGFLSFVLTWKIAFGGQGSFAIVGLVLVIPMPFLVGVAGALWVQILSLHVIATSNFGPNAPEIADALTHSLFCPIVGMLFTIANLMIATLGMTWQSVRAQEETSSIP